MDSEKFKLTANSRWTKCREFWRNWRNGARDDYKFVCGDQWMVEDEAVLKAQKRPPITFNYSEKMIDAVVGAEVSARQEVHYSGRGNEDAPLAEIWNAAAKWVRDSCDAEDEESDAFRDMLICGLGWTRTYIDYDEDLDGKICISRVDPLEMYPDPAAFKCGLTDRRWSDWLYWADETDAKKRWPQIDPLNDERGDDTARGVVMPGVSYVDTIEDNRDRHEGQVQLRMYETYELEDVYRVPNPQTGQLVELSASDFNKLNAELEFPKGSFVKQRKRKYYRAFFSGETMLEVKESPCQDGFCFTAITGKRDRNRNTWYGLTKVMKDPQRWANKWLSQIMHIINSNAKGGLMVEANAFVDQKKAEDEWAMPESITEFKPGMLSGKKVQQKQITPYPAGLDKLMEFALGSLPMVTGINLEALGLANRDQAGVVERQRKEAAYGLLSPLFASLRHYRKIQGRVLLYYINTYISDGRQVRIGGPESQQFQPLTKQEGAIKYDIIVDQSPTSPDSKTQTWDTLVEILPAMLKAGLPIPPVILDYTPLPTSLVTKWKETIGQQQQVDQKTQEEMQKLKEENSQLKNNTQVKMQELEFKQQEAGLQLQMEKDKMQAEIHLAREKAVAEFELKKYEQERAFELEQRRTDHEQTIQQQKTDNEFKVKAFAAGVQQDGKDDGKGGKHVSIGIDTSSFTDMMKKISDSHAQQSDDMTKALSMLAQVMSAPRKTRLVTDARGLPVGGESYIGN